MRTSLLLQEAAMSERKQTLEMEIVFRCMTRRLRLQKASPFRGVAQLCKNNGHGDLFRRKTYAGVDISASIGC